MSKSKKCTKCKVTKVLSKFAKRLASKKDGLTAMCNQCLRTKAVQVRSSRPEVTRAHNLKHRFNMTINEYNVMFLKQKGKCAICCKSEISLDTKGLVKWLSVDHNHKTGAIRGLLCSSCNTGIGKLCDSVKILKSAVKYLNKRGSYGEK